MPRATRGLTYEEVIRFHDQGYLIVEDLFTDGDLQPVIDEIGREITKRAQTLVDEGILTSTHEDLGFERQLTCWPSWTSRLMPCATSKTRARWKRPVVSGIWPAWP